MSPVGDISIERIGPLNKKPFTKLAKNESRANKVSFKFQVELRTCDHGTYKLVPTRLL